MAVRTSAHAVRRRPVKLRKVRRAPFWLGPALVLVLAALAAVTINGAREVVREQEADDRPEVTLVPFGADAEIGLGWVAGVQDVLRGPGATGFVLAEAPDALPLEEGLVHLLVLVRVAPAQAEPGEVPLFARVTDALNRPLGRPCPATPTPLPPVIRRSQGEVLGNVCTIVRAEEATGLRVALSVGEETEAVRFATQSERERR